MRPKSKRLKKGTEIEDKLLKRLDQLEKKIDQKLTTQNAMVVSIAEVLKEQVKTLVDQAADNMANDASRSLSNYSLSEYSRSRSGSRDRMGHMKPKFSYSQEIGRTYSQDKFSNHRYDYSMEASDIDSDFDKPSTSL